MIQVWLGNGYLEDGNVLPYTKVFQISEEEFRKIVAENSMFTITAEEACEDLETLIREKKLPGYTGRELQDDDTIVIGKDHFSKSYKGWREGSYLSEMSSPVELFGNYTFFDKGDAEARNTAAKVLEEKKQVIEKLLGADVKIVNISVNVSTHGFGDTVIEDNTTAYNAFFELEALVTRLGGNHDEIVKEEVAPLHAEFQQILGTPVKLTVGGEVLCKDGSWRFCKVDRPE